MKPLSPRVLVIGILLLFTLSIASGKAPLSKIFISGGRLPRPIEITDPKLLQSSNPWLGTFIPQWNQVSLQDVGDPPHAVARYELSFYATYSSGERLIYVAYYAFDQVSHRGLVYLPGPQEQWYDTNARSLLRPHQEGHWNVADPTWCDQVNSIVARGDEMAAAPAH